MPNAFQVAGLATHALVLLIGLGTILGLVPLARGRRGGFGLVRMATAMTIVVLEPRLRLGRSGSAPRGRLPGRSVAATRPRTAKF